MNRVVGKLGLVIVIVLVLFVPRKAYAQWPPFGFSLSPTLENGKITYSIDFYKSVDWVMTDVTFKIPLPEGTRFVEAHVPPSSKVDFDGAEMTFVTANIPGWAISDLSFVVEVTDPTKTIFTTRAWIAWKGDQPGDYLMPDMSFDITTQLLRWTGGATAWLQLDANAIVENEIITYKIYPRNVNKLGYIRMQDVKINIPLPAGTTFISVEESPPFVANFDGQEVSFFATELEQYADIAPLSFKVSAAGVEAPFLTTHAWATWKNVGFNVGITTEAQAETRTGDIIVQPRTWQWVAADTIGDVPFSNYDLTSIAFQEEEGALRVTFYTNGDLGPIGQPLQFFLFIDSDCRVDTGERKGERGGDYLIWYSHQNSQADFLAWDMELNKWDFTRQERLPSAPNVNQINIWLPANLLPDYRQFCWFVEAKNETKDFYPSPPSELLPDRNASQLTRYQTVSITPTTAITAASTDNEPMTGIFINPGDDWLYLPAWSELPSNWYTVDFDDSNWYTGPTAIGYGSGNYATDLSDVLSTMQFAGGPLLEQHTITETGVVLAVLSSGEHQNVFLRHAFDIPDPNALIRLTLDIDYQGGFVAYLNGVEVARRNLGEPNSPVFYDTLGEAAPETNVTESIDLSSYIANLVPVPGSNILAIQAHRAENSSSLSINPKLSWSNYPWDAPIQQANNQPGADETILAGPSPTFSIDNLSGKLAIPLDNGQIAYYIHIFSIPNGQEIATISNARQPNFRADGKRLLINRESGGVENVYEYNLADQTEKQVSDAPQDWYPFYDPWGNRVVYGNSELTVGADGLRHPYIFVQCSLRPPHQEVELRCRNIAWLGVLVPAGQVGEIQGTHPVWTTNDMIAYKGCNSWAGFAACGIYIVPSSSTKGFSNGFIPRQLTKGTSDIPSDTKGDLIAFTSRRDGDWEAYVMDLNGAQVKNVSNSPNSNDGLPTISPDGNWIAFVSDRGDQWAIWVVPVLGGSAQKLFNLPVDVPWGDGNRVWTNERISWGP